MAAKAISASSCFSCSSSPNLQRKRAPQLALWKSSIGCNNCNFRCSAVGKAQSCQCRNAILKANVKLSRRAFGLAATLRDDLPNEGMETDASDDEEYNLGTESISPATLSFVHHGENGGKPGFISFYRPPKREVLTSLSNVQMKHNSMLWFVGPTVLVATFIFPSLYLRKILSSVCEDSLLTDFLILFFTEALFYCGVALFLTLMDHLWRPAQSVSATSSSGNLSSHLSYRISSVALLVLSLIIPMVTMGFVWPWTGPAASATLAPYLVGIVVQFTFEQYATYVKSPSWPVIPIIFQVYRLHQLNRAAQLVTALSFTVRGAEMTSHNLAINNSLGTLLNVLQLLGVLCIWSLSSFLVRFFPSSITGQ